MRNAQPPRSPRRAPHSDAGRLTPAGSEQPNEEADTGGPAAGCGGGCCEPGVAAREAAGAAQEGAGGAFTSRCAITRYHNVDQFQRHREWIGGSNKEQFRSRNRLGKGIRFKEKGEGGRTEGKLKL